MDDTDPANIAAELEMVRVRAERTAEMAEHYGLEPDHWDQAEIDRAFLLDEVDRLRAEVAEAWSEGYGTGKAHVEQAWEADEYPAAEMPNPYRVAP